MVVHVKAKQHIFFLKLHIMVVGERKHVIVVSGVTGNCTSNKSWACFLRYLRIINTSTVFEKKNDISILKQILLEAQNFVRFDQ